MKLKHKITKSGCWRCISHCTNSSGYVRINYKGQQMYGHRYVYIQKYGKIKDQVIRHTCDNKWCINPEHLIQGSHSDNVKDRVVRNRSAKGINNGRSKLSEESVINIFNDNTTPKTLLAKKFDIDPKVIRDIKNKVKWKYLTKKL